MSKEQLKEEIVRVLDHFSTDSLSDILALLKKLDEKHAIGNYSIEQLLNKIISEDHSLLSRLAK